jgi:hypothetical protein
MSRRTWIVVLVAAGVGLALLLGFVARSQSVGETQYCDSLASLKSSVGNLLALDPATATQGEFQSDLEAVQNDWSSVKSAAEDLHASNASALENAWSSFAGAVKSIPSDASAGTAQSHVSQSAQALESAVASAFSSYDCSSTS